MTKAVTNAELAERIGTLADLMQQSFERIGALETEPEIVQASAVTPVVARTRVKAQDAELGRLRLAVPKEAKAKFIETCAEHSYAALETLILAGSRVARAFMAGEGVAATEQGEFALVVDHPNGKYACAMLGRHENLPVTAHSARAKRPPTQEMHADMSDAQLLKFRPASQRQNAPSRKAWVLRQRTRLA